MSLMRRGSKLSTAGRLALSLALALGPFASVPAEARKRVQAPTSFFCPMGALASFYAPTSNLPMNDGCFTAKQPATNGGTGGFQLSNCWANGGAANQWNGTTTDYTAANASPLTVSTPYDSPGCEYPVANWTPVASLADPAPSGVSAIADCVYSATGNFAGYPQMTCNPTITNYPSGVFSVQGYDFHAANGGTTCLPLYIHNATGAITEIDLINNYFKNTNGVCSTYVFNPVFVNIDTYSGASTGLVRIENNTFDGNGFVWRTNSGGCPTYNIKCTPEESLQYLGGNAIVKNNLFTNFIGRTIGTRTDTNENLSLIGNLWLGGDVSGPEHGEFTQTFTDGTPNGDSIHAYNNWWKTTGSTSAWDAMDLTTYTCGGPPCLSTNGWTHNVVDHNVYIAGFAGGGDKTGTLTGCSIAAGTSTMVCTGVSGGSAGAGMLSPNSPSACGTDQITYQLGYLISATGVQGTDWDNAGPGGGKWVKKGGSTWALDANPSGNRFTFVGGIDDGTGTGTAGNILTVTTAGGYNLDPNALQSIFTNTAQAVFTETSTNNFNNGDTLHLGNNTYTMDSAVPTVAGHVYIGNANLQASGFAQSVDNLTAAINSAAQPKAQAVLSMSTNFSNGDTLVIGNNTFHTVSALGATAGNVLIGVSNSATITNLGTAIQGTCSTTCVTPANTPNITSVNNNGGKATFSAITAGASGNSLVSTYVGGGTGSFVTGATFINGVAYVAPGTTPNITAANTNTTLTLTAIATAAAGNANASVYTTGGAAAGSFPAATFLNGVAGTTYTAYLSGSTGGLGKYCLTGGVGGTCTAGAGAQYVPAGSTFTTSLFPYYAGQWSVVQTNTCASQTVTNSTAPAVITYMGAPNHNGFAFTNNLVDSSVIGGTWATWWQQVLTVPGPGCITNDMIGFDPANPSFAIFGTQNFDMAKILTNINRWNTSSFNANGCGT